MWLGIALLISAGLAILVVAPLLAPEKPGEGTFSVDITPLADLKRRRLVVYDNLQDLEFEFKAGKIARDDYQSLRENYVAEAAQLMVASQEEEQLTSDSALVERVVATRRALRKLQPSEEYLCQDCGFENPLPVKFCGECGARIKPREQKA
jgi:hypothetical protein